MSSITFADNKLGGRVVAACDAIAAGHLNRAAGILAELADELNQEATATGLLAIVDAIVDAVDDVPTLDKLDPVAVETELAKLAVVSAPADLQMCSRGVHSFGPTDPATGWRECSSCGQVNVAPPENQIEALRASTDA